MKKIFCIILSAALLLGIGCSAALAESTGSAGASSSEPVEGETAVSSLLNVVGEPTDLLQIGKDDFLITDAYHKLVYRVKNGETSVYAGRETAGNLYGEPVGGYYDTKSDRSWFSYPWAIAPFVDGYAVSDTANSCVRYISEKATDTITGNGTPGSKTGSGTAATFDRPTGLATDDNGDLYVADTGNNRLCLVNHTTGKVSLVLSDLDEPTALCWHDGALYICESGSNRVLKLANGKTTVIAGTGTADLVDGAADKACFNNPMGIAVSDNGTIYVSDTGSSAIRMIKDGEVSTLLQPDDASLSSYPALPTGLLWSDGLLYVCDTYANMVYTIAAPD